MWRLCLCGALFIGCPKSTEETLSAEVRADGYYLASQTAYVKGDFAAAHAALEKVKLVRPDDPRLPAALGELFLSEGKLDESLTAFEQATKLDVKRSTNWSRLGYLYLLKQSPQAMPALEKALSANPNDLNAHETLGEMALKAGDVDGGVSHTVRAAQLAVTDKARSELVLKAFGALLRSMRGSEATALLMQASGEGRLTAEVYVELGDRLAAERRLREALPFYMKAAELDAQDPTLWEIVGEVQVELGQVDDAREAFAKSLAIKPRGVVHVTLARLCQRQKDEPCAQRELEAALETASGAEVREALELASLLADMSRGKDALELYKTVLGEPEAAKDFDLQLRVARLAKQFKDSEMMALACGKAMRLRVGARCP